MKRDAILVGMLNPFDAEQVAQIRAAGVTAFALESIPRTTRRAKHGCALVASQYCRL